MKLNTKFNYPKSIRAYYNGQRLYDINSEKLPSVTTILNATKSEEQKASLERWRQKVGAKEADQIIENGLRNHVSEVWGVESTLYYPKKYAGATDLLCILDGKETVVDFKNSSKPRKDEWNHDYYLQLGAYSLAHNFVYGTNINQGVILLCTKDLMFQRFIIDSEKLKDYQNKFLERV